MEYGLHLVEMVDQGDFVPQKDWEVAEEVAARYPSNWAAEEQKQESWLWADGRVSPQTEGEEEGGAQQRQIVLLAQILEAGGENLRQCLIGCLTCLDGHCHISAWLQNLEEEILLLEILSD